MSDTTATDGDAAMEAALEQIQYFVRAFTMPVLVGTCLSCLFAGLVTSLIWRYFAKFGSTDRLAFRFLVGFYLVALLADTATQIAWTYSYAINGQLDPANIYRLPREFMAFTAITAITVFVAQIFFNWRIWIISGRKNWLLCGAVCFLQVGAMACGVYMFVAMAKEEWFPQFGDVRQAPWAWLGAGLGTDVLITAGMTYYLIVVPRLDGVNARRNQVVRSPLRRLAIQTFQTNAVSLYVQTVTLGMMIYNLTNMNYAIPGFQEAKIYIASVVITLNSRHTSENSAHFSESNPNATGRSKALGGLSSRFGRSTAGAGLVSQQQQQSIHVSAEHERGVDEVERSVTVSRPYTVKFERVESNWIGPEKGDLELGRLEDIHLEKL